MIRFIPAPFPVAARRTGHADFPHPALSGIMPSPTEGRALARTVLEVQHKLNARRDGGDSLDPRRLLSPQPPAGPRALGTMSVRRLIPGLARRCRQFVETCSTSSFAFTCGALLSFSTVVGVTRLMRQSPVARSCQHRSQTKGPSLHRHYPASPVLRPYPPPQGAGSVPHDTTVGQRRHASHPEGLPVLHTIPLRTCRRHYPGGTVGCSRRSPSPTAAAFPETQAGRLPHCPFRGLLGVHCTLRPARSLSPLRTLFHRKLRLLRCLHRRSDCYRLERPLPGGTCTHWDRAPLHGALNHAV